jgi:hypothetical protein
MRRSAAQVTASTERAAAAEQALVRAQERCSELEHSAVGREAAAQEAAVLLEETRATLQAKAVELRRVRPILAHSESSEASRTF